METLPMSPPLFNSLPRGPKQQNSSTRCRPTPGRTSFGCRSRRIPKMTRIYTARDLLGNKQISYWMQYMILILSSTIIFQMILGGLMWVHKAVDSSNHWEKMSCHSQRQLVPEIGLMCWKRTRLMRDLNIPKWINIYRSIKLCTYACIYAYRYIHRYTCLSCVSVCRIEPITSL